tara:strand:- start:231 stop:587 length:357 start_codon:yes stop_codon:yes gene_type:complete
MKKVRFSGKKIQIDRKTIILDREIDDLIVINHKIIVLLKVHITQGRDHNLICLNDYGNILWIAELPNRPVDLPNTSSLELDFYWSIRASHPLSVGTFSSYNCEIDINTGKLISQEFTR